jgi:hypothetical protein
MPYFTRQNSLIKLEKLPTLKHRTGGSSSMVLRENDAVLRMEK